MSLKCSQAIVALLIFLIAIGDYTIVQAQEEPLIIGIFPRRNATDTYKYFKPLADYLGQQLNRSVEIETSKDFDTFWRGVESKRYDLVHFNQYHYILSHKSFNYQVIVKNREFGEETIAGAIVVRKDSGINSVMDLKGKTIVFGGDSKAMISYIAATYLLRQGGLQAGDYQEEFAKNPPNAILSVYYEQVAAAGSGDKILNLGVVTSQINTDELKILVSGEPLAHLPWAVKGDMSATLRDKIQTLLINLNQSPAGKAILKNARLTDLVIANDAEFDKHREIINKLYPQ